MQDIKKHAIQGAQDDIDAPGAETDAEIVYIAVPGFAHAISGVAWSYQGDVTDLTTGNLTITDEVLGVIFSIDITATGAGFFPFPKGKKGSINSDLTITLADGGTDMIGKVSVLEHWLER